MKTNKLLLISLFILSIFSCKTYKKDLLKTGNSEQAINNAIIDFTHIKRLYKKDTVFYVSVEKSKNQKIVVVSISRNSTKLLFSKKIKVGKINKAFPSRYLNIDGNIFYWYDNNYPLTQETLDVFNNYNLVQDDMGGYRPFPDALPISEWEKGVDYYFCKNDLVKYKRVVTNIGYGYYSPPSLKCPKE